eukprot:CAMPEP_0203954780 /NCGR_PEP_ID=MMETSP0359-20131031/87639_1 /ASSEMBLY_ACC=CAM_ASM_000338 /TAXON_ID=268821 /ORGANISM="Scrippsiella Hangoei, Strain SHTV-5" /LENGTH=858 /DNA_ID=CAMNT_0050888315 /DNA_START=105 /DNA_END=2681 /DNA_ORIENTATION=+
MCLFSAGPPPGLDVVFVLDAMSSMSGVIEHAKAHILELGSRVANQGPRPRQVRFGAVFYRDRCVREVYRSVPLTTDLQLVRDQIQDVFAEGGGDRREHLGLALHQALSMEWSGRLSRSVRLIYVVADAPAHHDYDDGFDVESAVVQAKQRGIKIHAVGCHGFVADIEAEFRDMVQSTGGKFQFLKRAPEEQAHPHTGTGGRGRTFGAAAPGPDGVVLLGSESLSVRSFVRMGSSLSVLDFTRLGASLARSISAMVHVGSAVSVRSFDSLDAAHAAKPASERFPTNGSSSTSGNKSTDGAPSDAAGLMAEFLKRSWQAHPHAVSGGHGRTFGAAAHSSDRSVLLGSEALSVRSFARMGSALSFLAFTRLDASVARSSSAMVRVGSAVSVRSFASLDTAHVAKPASERYPTNGSSSTSGYESTDGAASDAAGLMAEFLKRSWLAHPHAGAGGRGRTFGAAAPRPDGVVLLGSESLSVRRFGRMDSSLSVLDFVRLDVSLAKSSSAMVHVGSEVSVRSFASPDTAHVAKPASERFPTNGSSSTSGNESTDVAASDAAGLMPEFLKRKPEEQAHPHAGAGGRGRTFGAAAPGPDGDVRLGSEALSVRSFVRMGSSLTVLDFTRLGASLARSISAMVHVGSAVSVRSFDSLDAAHVAKPASARFPTNGSSSTSGNESTDGAACDAAGLMAEFLKRSWQAHPHAVSGGHARAFGATVPSPDRDVLLGSEALSVRSFVRMGSSLSSLDITRFDASMAKSSSAMVRVGSAVCVRSFASLDTPHVAKPASERSPTNGSSSTSGNESTDIAACDAAGLMADLCCWLIGGADKASEEAALSELSSEQWSPTTGGNSLVQMLYDSINDEL